MDSVQVVKSIDAASGESCWIVVLPAGSGAIVKCSTRAMADELVAGFRSRRVPTVNYGHPASSDGSVAP